MALCEAVSFAAQNFNNRCFLSRVVCSTPSGRRRKPGSEKFFLDAWYTTAVSIVDRPNAFARGYAVGQFVFWNRRAGGDRRGDQNTYQLSDERRIIDRRLYGDNGFVLIIGHTGVDRFTLLVTLPGLAITVVALFLSSAALF